MLSHIYGCWKSTGEFLAVVRRWDQCQDYGRSKYSILHTPALGLCNGLKLWRLPSVLSASEPPTILSMTDFVLPWATSHPRLRKQPYKTMPRDWPSGLRGAPSCSSTAPSYTLSTSRQLAIYRRLQLWRSWAAVRPLIRYWPSSPSLTWPHGWCNDFVWIQKTFVWIYSICYLHMYSYSIIETKCFRLFVDSLSHLLTLRTCGR
jgi:hypothetical protein